ncbi:ArnT family glycosyltransferase [Ichthyenterobacterium magnum]|uniref:4-amino-4-deoxy-L-arabinose transferase-like glycosyltransferase n=1 Tax=Ichthyenterobacterium magnum TaxID=1230530 RepID=A0A420DUS8_9FLAO|nr:glycosyltransferase family 39 protein [Ichthyenterobacterium magnum]RKE98026.1 4-amino-4-deoxy-L-arabinose transferase-like glycosyltransferase [Ichthyenterobacterium magnum]
MLQKLHKNPILTIAFLVIIMLGFNLDALQVSIMEARNFITAREMLVDNNWLLTTMNGEARYQKPPLPAWISTVFAFVLGIKNVFAYRLPALLFIIITGIYTYLISKKIVSNSVHSFNNALIIITSFYVIGITFEAPSDIFTHSFMLIGMYYLFQLFSNYGNYLKHSIIAGVFIGLSILSKGPVSFYVLLLPFLLAYGFSYKYKFNKRLLFSFLLCLIIALIVGGWWYLYVRVYDAETFTAIAKKETGNWSSYNVRPFYYYWSFFTQSGLWTIPAFIALIYPYLKTRVSNLKAYKFSFYWTIFAVVLLSIIPEKKSRYLMPVLIPLAINTGFYIEYLIRKFKDLKDKRETIPVYFNFGLIALIGITFPVIGYIFLGEKLSNHWLLFSLASIVLFNIGLFILIKLRKKNIQSVFNLAVLFFIALLFFALPLSKLLISENYKPITSLNENAMNKNLNVYSIDLLTPEIVWQFGDKVKTIKKGSEFVFPKEHTFGLLANTNNLNDIEILKNDYIVEYQNTYDINISDTNSRQYKDRLVNQYYILTKK